MSKTKQEITDILQQTIDGSQVEAYKSIEYAAVKPANREREQRRNAFFRGLIISIGVVAVFEAWLFFIEPDFKYPVGHVSAVDTVKAVIFYDTLETAAHAFRTKYTIPYEYGIEQDSITKLYYATFTFSDGTGTVYLDKSFYGFTPFFFNRHLAAGFKTPRQVVEKIREHIQERNNDQHKKQ